MAMTRNQRIILAAAAGHENGLVAFGSPDRRGTRVAGHTGSGIPIIVAYQSPEWHLTQRGWLERCGTERGVYRITDAGRIALMAAEARA